MVMLATVEETKLFLRYDDGGMEQDEIIADAIRDMSEAVLAYLKVPSAFFDESDFEESDAEIPGSIRRATMIWVGIILRDPSGVESQSLDEGLPPRVVMNLLYPFRDPAMSTASSSDSDTSAIPPWWCCWQR